MDITLDKIFINIAYLTILGIGTNLFVEMFKKNKESGAWILWFAWLVGSIVCILLGFDFLYRIGLLEIRYYFFDFIFSGFLCANISRFLHKFFEFIKEYKKEAK